jgi:DNA-binding MarR family transcriptional regulator
MSGGLTEEHKRAWVALVVSYHVVARKIDRAMRDAGVISLDVYDALLTLEDAPDRRLKMSELADAVLLTRSGITRLTDRLERDGLIQRVHCPADRRVTYASLTDKGLEERIRAWEVYREKIAEHFASQITSEEASMVACVLGRLRASAPRPISC